MLTAQLGFAADDLGNGIAYARLATRAGDRLVRAAFRAMRFQGLGGREIGYGAVAAIASMLRERGVERVRFLVPDAELVVDCTERRGVPAALVLPYVRLRCALNRFVAFDLQYGEDPDLDGRARAELFVSTAA